MLPEVELRPVSREDVARMAQWLKDPEVNGSWYGVDARGNPVHIGYVPEQLIHASAEDWRAAFDSEHRKIFSVYLPSGEHIGEAQLEIDPVLHSGEVFILIGRKDLWFRGYGSAAMIKLLDLAFYTYKLHRVSADVPSYNQPALYMCENIGFHLEGYLRGRRYKDGKWYDSVVMGLLEDEYARRRARLVGQAAPQATSGGTSSPSTPTPPSG